mmetsp:Transcript_11152/g.31652  ORF Transcript_11152/g.31652 Transcript_11152/m.31652 type:complete len:363 (+) Transcript_11152:389-1477(+)
MSTRAPLRFSSTALPRRRPSAAATPPPGTPTRLSKKCSKSFSTLANRSSSTSNRRLPPARHRLTRTRAPACSSPSRASNSAQGHPTRSLIRRIITLALAPAPATLQTITTTTTTTTTTRKNTNDWPCCNSATARTSSRPTPRTWVAQVFIIANRSTATPRTTQGPARHTRHSRRPPSGLSTWPTPTNSIPTRATCSTYSTTCPSKRGISRASSSMLRPPQHPRTAHGLPAILGRTTATPPNASSRSRYRRATLPVSCSRSTPRCSLGSLPHTTATRSTSSSGSSKSAFTSWIRTPSCRLPTHRRTLPTTAIATLLSCAPARSGTPTRPVLQFSTIMICRTSSSPSSASRRLKIISRNRTPFP